MPLTTAAKRAAATTASQALNTYVSAPGTQYNRKFEAFDIRALAIMSDQGTQPKPDILRKR